MKKIEIINGKVKQKGEPLPESITEWRWLDVVTHDAPTYDENTHKLKRVETINASTYDITFEAIPLTDAEKLSVATAKATDAVIKTGFDTGKGYNFAIEETDRNAFTQLMVLLENAGVPSEYEVAVTDINGTEHTITYGELKPILIAYGQYCLSLRG